MLFVGLSIISGELEQIKKCRTEYTYIDMDGNKGFSRHCFQDGDTYICRNIKRGIRVSKVHEKRICD